MLRRKPLHLSLLSPHQPRNLLFHPHQILSEGSHCLEAVQERHQEVRMMICSPVPAVLLVSPVSSLIGDLSLTRVMPNFFSS